MTMIRWPLFCLAFGILLPKADAETPRFDRDLLPILQERCLGCHGPDEESSGLSVESLGHLKRGGDNGEMVIPGKSGESLLLKVLTGAGDIPRMPLDEEPLTDEQIAKFREWVDAGAPGWTETPLARRVVKSDHWSFQPIRSPEVPEPARRETIRNPIDAFVQTRLQREDLEPSVEADRLTLLRRLSLDLLGLLPSPEEQARFLSDTAPGAYERLVERLLAAPNYGERWGRHWLDAARYADSNGYTIDSARSIWPYRDWVIDAMNRDLPFDQFVIEQLAGDLLPNPTTDQLIATGFHRNTLINEEGGTDKEQFRVEAVVDRVSTTGTVFLGLTVGCAQCHTHKFDPITQREFYQLFAVFNQCDEPNLDLPTPEQLSQRNELNRQLAAAQKALKEHESAGESVAEAKASAAAFVDWAKANPKVWKPLALQSVSAVGKTRFEKLDDESWLTKDAENHETFVLEFATSSEPLRGLRIEALTHESIKNRGPGLTEHGNFTLNEATLETADGKPIRVIAAQADHAQPGGPAANAIDGDAKTFWAVNANGKDQHSDREIQLLIDPAAEIPAGTALRLKLHQAYGSMPYVIGRFRISESAASGDYLQLPLLTRRKWEAAGWDDARFAAELERELLNVDGERKRLESQVAAIQAEIKNLNARITRTMIFRKKAESRQTFVHVKGDFLRPGVEVQPAVLDVLHPLPEGLKQLDRLGFARWLVDSRNPLTPRVTVNRIWQHYFGLGLVETENDFGTQGATPSHPELLDWLALEFMRGGWSLKSLHRLIVTSHTYRQSSALRTDLLERDPRNRLLARQSRVRLEAEVIRDVALDSAGLLYDKLGGPGVYPPQPEGIGLFTQVNRKWDTETGPERYRRGLYTYLWRSNLYPLFPTFDAPGATMACTRRARSNTPLQALTLANDIAFVETAQALARRLLTEGPEEDRRRLRHAWELCLNREPNSQELETLESFLADQRNALGDEKKARSICGPVLLKEVPLTEQAAWTLTARVLLNLDEFITRE